MQHNIITTGDGSHTIFVPELNEHYHSTNGAVRESCHVFIEAGFRHYLEKRVQLQEQSPQINAISEYQTQINILEIGFGTGLNTFMTLLETEKIPVKVFYQSVELYPITFEEAQKLNYREVVQHLEHLQHNAIAPQSEMVKRSEKINNFFLQLHSSPWDSAVEIIPNFTLLKNKFDFTQPQEFISDRQFNLIYFDAFAPNKQPDMWTRGIFNKIYSVCADDAVFTTYCAKGAVRRMLHSVGFVMEQLPGPPGKREMLRGIINAKNNPRA